MSQFDDLERAYEAKFAHDEEMNFRIVARRNRLIGEWAGRKMGLTEEETSSYAKDVVRADFESAGDDDVVRNRAAAYQAECREKRAISKSLPISVMRRRSRT